MYNYLDLQAKMIDGKGNETKYSYDSLLNLSETKYESNDSTMFDNSFQNGLTYNFGTIPGLVNKQKFTDEEGNYFEKYFDAVGNLLREVKYVYNESEQIVALNTDYRYDSLYRITHVRSPEGKIISYAYDGYGRQSMRTTPDAGSVKYKYDKNDNMRFSQDENQAKKPDDYRPSRNYDFKGYDGLNRLLYLGDIIDDSYLETFANLNPESTYNFEDYDLAPTNFLTINVYDTLSTDFSGEFSSPDDYYNTNNYTKGKLVATAYRTRGADDWSFKYYRYDVRGRVIRMWHLIDDMEKTIEYTYNSQDQITYINYQYAEESEYKRFQYIYDKAGRLTDVNIFVPEPGGDPEEGTYENFTSYEYDQNSQISNQSFDDDNIETDYGYNNRNWINSATNNNIFGYTLSYYKNGNVEEQVLTGDYIDNFETIEAENLEITYTYDMSNRLLTADVTSYDDPTYDLENTYDYDGNLLTMNRYGVNDILHEFDYDYISGTNKVKKVSGGSDQFTYDYNGNVLTDFMFNTRDMIYDHRNLLIEFRKVVVEHGNDWTRYYYDDAGNRIRKYTIRSSSQEPPAPNWNNVGDDPNWWVVSNEYYYRDVAGNEIAIYESDQLKQWNVYGSDNVGKINSNDSLFFYLKDHIGSIRVVLNVDNTVVNCEDYDMWGYPFLGRTFTEYPAVWERYKFTSKERDVESFYDYFGARYYMNVIGRWGSVDPLLEKHYDFSPYVYVLDNPLKFIDPEGKQVDIIELAIQVYSSFKSQQILQENYMEMSSEERAAYLGMTMGEYESGRVEQTGDEMLAAELLFPAFRIGRVSLSLIGATTRSTTTKLTTRYTVHSIDQMLERGITEKMVQKTLEKGKYFWDPKNKSFNYILEKSFASGKDLLVAVDLSKAIKTVIRGEKLVKPRHLSISKDAMRTLKNLGF